MKTSATATSAILALFGFAASCNFDAAFKRYCENNPQCGADAGIAVEAGKGGETGEVAPPIPPPKSCATNSDCPNPDESCNPYSHLCMKTCATSADCPPWLDTCLPIPSPAPVQGVCACTAQSCNSYDTTFTCQLWDGLCEPMCTTPQDCSGFQPPRFCDLESGLCLIAPLKACTRNSDCVYSVQPRCDPSTFWCTSCVSSSDCAGRPDNLTQCDSAGTCVSP